MTAAADGDIRLAQATPPIPAPQVPIPVPAPAPVPAPEAAAPEAAAPDAARRRVTFAPGVRRIIDLQPGETVEIVAQPTELTYRRTAEGLLVISSAGGEALLRGVDAQGSTSTIVVGEVVRPILDVVAGALQDVTPAAGQPGGPPAPTGPIAPGSGLGSFGNLVINPLVGLTDTGPLGFSPLRRTAPEPEFRSLRPDAGGAGGGGPGGAGDGDALSPDVALSVANVSAIETDAPVTLALSLGVAIVDSDGAPAETLQRLVITFAETPPAGTQVSAGTLAGNVLTLDIADFADEAALNAAIAALTVTLPADWAGVLNATAQATTSEGVSTVEAFALTVTPAGDISAAGTSDTAAETDAPVTLDIPATAVITDANGQVPETLARVEITFTGLPAGSSFSSGTLVGGVLTLDVATLDSPSALEAALAALQVTVPADWSGVVPASIVAFSTEGASAPAAFTLTVTPTPDVTAVGTDVAAAQSPAPLTLAIPIATTITDVSAGAPELLQRVTISFTGLPPGAAFSAGTLLGNVLTLDVGAFGNDPAALQAALSSLTITLPANFVGPIAASIVPVSNEGTGPSAGFDIAVAPVAVPVPIAGAAGATTAEDLPNGAVALSATLTAATNATASWVVISNIPADVTFNVGTPAGPGAIRVEAAELASLALVTLPPNSDADLALSLTPFSEVAGVTIAGNPVPLTVVVDAIADQPNLTAPPSLSVAEGASVALGIASSLVDTDGSETLSLAVSGIPAGSLLISGGVTLAPGAGGVYTLTPAQLAGLTLTPPAFSAGDTVLTITATATETTLSGSETDLTNNVATSLATIALTVTPGIGLVPTVAATPAEALEDLPLGNLPVALALTPATNATSSWVEISGIPAGVTFNVGTPIAPGVIRVDSAALAGLSLAGLPLHSDADLALTVTPVSIVNSAPVRGAAAPWIIVVDAVADAPTIAAAGGPGVEDQRIALTLAVAAVDTDGSETLGSVTLTNVPSGSELSRVVGATTTVLSPSSSASGIDSYVLSPADLAGLGITPPPDFNGSLALQVIASSTETAFAGLEPNLANNTAATTTSLVIDVAGVSDTPTLAGIPGAAGFEDLAGGPIAAPITVTAGAPNETAFVVVSGLPAGVVLNAGVPSALVAGGIRLSAAEAAALQIVGLPSNSDRDFTLTVTPFSQDGVAAPVAGAARDLTVTVDAVADAPLLTAAPASGSEDVAIALSIGASLADTDGSETFTGITIGGVPAGAALISGGTTLVPSGGFYTLTPAQLANLVLQPAPNATGNVTLAITAGVTDTPSDSGELTVANNTASATTTLVVTISPVSDTPGLALPDGVGIKEDLGAGTIAQAPPALGPAAIAILVTPGAPGESAFVDISGIPAGVAFNTAGTQVAPGVLRFTQAEAAGLSITALPGNSDADLRLTVTPLSIDGTAPPNFGAPQILTVTVDAVADLPIVARAGNSGLEDQPIALRLTAALTDTDGSETLGSVRLTGVPKGSIISYVAGGVTMTVDASSSANGFDVYDLDATQAATATLRPPTDFRGSIVLGATITARESNLSDGEANLADNLASATGTFTISVAPLSDVPQILPSVTAVALREDLGVDRPGGPLVADGGRAIGATIIPGAVGETAFLVVSGIPAGVTFNASGATTTLVPGGVRFSAAEAAALAITGLPNDSDGDFVLTFTPFSQDGSATPRAGAPVTVAVTVDAVADRPDFGGTIVGREDSAIALNLVARLGDLDGSEVMQGATISGLPSGFALATIAGGVTTTLVPSGGSYVVSESDIPRLNVIAPRDANGSVTLSLTLEVREQAALGSGELFLGDNVARESGTLVLSVTPISDRPGLTVPTLILGKEDLGDPSPGAGTPGTSGGFATGGVPSGPIALPVIATPGAPNETASVVISGIPAGMSFTGGVIGGDGRLTLTPTAAAALSITALPTHVGGDIALTVTALSLDGGAPASSVSQVVTLRLDSVADIPQLTVTPIAITEDEIEDGAFQRVPLGIDAALVDRDGSEALTLVITGVPAGMRLSAGSFDPNSGTWTVPQAAIGGLQLIAALGIDAAFDLGVTAIARETGTDSDTADNVATRFASLPVRIVADADMPTLVVGGKAKGFEDSFIPLAITSALVDTDGSETLAIRLDGVPVGSVLRSGTTTFAPVASGGGVDSYVLTPAQLAGLEVRPPQDSNVDFILGVTATATETSNGSTAQRIAAITVDVVGVSDGATLNAGAASAEDGVDAAGGRVPLNIVAGILDTDASAGRPISETVTAIVIAGVPAGYALSHGLVTAIAADGSTSWTLKKLDVGNEWDAVELLGWPTHLAGTIDLRASVVTTENDGDTATTAFAFPLVVTPVVDDFVPSGSGTGDEDARIALTISPGLIDRDGSERVLGPVTISGIPSDTVVRSGDRVLAPASVSGGLQTYVVPEADLGSLSIQTAQDLNHDFTLSATMTISEFDDGGAPIAGQSRTESFDVPVTVIGVADTPDALAAPLAGEAGADFATTLGATLADIDGSERAYFIVSGTGEGMGLDLSDTAPANSVLRALGDGQWLVDATAIGFIRIRTMASFADGGTTVVPLTLTAVAEENDGNRDREAVTRVFDVTITPSSGSSGDERGEPGYPGDPPALSALTTISGVEDQPVPLVLSITGVPADAEVAVTISRGSLPAGTRITASSPDAIFVDPVTGDFIVLAEPAVLATLALVLPADFAGSFTPTITATATYQDGSIGRTTIAPTVAIAPVADLADAAAGGVGAEDALVKLDLRAGVTDLDGSERVAELRIANLSDGAVLTNAAGIVLPSAGGIYTIADANDVYVRSPTHLHGTRRFDLLVTTTDLVAGFPATSAVTTVAGSVTVAAEADAATIVGPAVLAGVEDLGAALGGAGRIVVSPVDADVSEVLSVVVQVLATPPGVQATDVRLSAGIDNGDGTWTLTNAEFAGASLLLPEGRAGDVSIRVVANSFELSNGDTAVAEHLATVSIVAAADAPTLAVSAATGAEDNPIALAIAAELGDTDGSESLAITIGNLPGGASLSAGVDNGDGSWSLLPDDLDGLVFNPPADAFGIFDLAVTARATELGGGTPAEASVSTTLRVEVADVVDSFLGTSGPDLLIGTDGADVIEGRGGADTLAGGPGPDRFAYGGDALDAADLITDFESGDRLDLGALLSTLGGTPASANDFISIVQSDTSVEVRVDQNGPLAGDTSTLLATIQDQAAAQVRSQTDFA